MNISSLQPLVDSKSCSRAMMVKMASSGIQLKHLELAYTRNGENGVAVLLGERDFRGKIRVSKSKRIITSICVFLAKKDTN